MNTTELNKKAMIDAMVKSIGIVTTACKKVGIGRTQYYAWLKEDPEFKKAINDIEEIALDYVESQLHAQIGDGNVAATIFYLKTKGKARGYIERQEWDLTTKGKEITIQQNTIIDVKVLSLETLLELKAAYANRRIADQQGLTTGDTDNGADL